MKKIINTAKKQSLQRKTSNKCARGGSAIIVRSSLKHHEGSKISSAEFQATAIVTEINGSKILYATFIVRQDIILNVIIINDYLNKSVNGLLLEEILSIPTGGLD